MGFEIERKWLIKELPEEALSFPHKEFVQGYLCAEPTVRVRKEGDEYVLTYKGAGLLKREEYNLPLTKEAFEHLIAKCDGRLIHKTRYFIPYEEALCLSVSTDKKCSSQQEDTAKQELFIELDIYHGDYEGLMTAEVEFSSEESAGGFMAPDWFSDDVTLRPEYKNSALAMRNV